MSKFTKPQQALLESAAAADGGLIDAPPEGDRTLATLVRNGFAIIAPGDGDVRRMLITAEGRTAIGQPPVAKARSRPKAAAEPPVANPTSKIATVVTLLRRAEGASLQVLMGATGWQAHSVRGALSGAIKKKLGLPVTSERVGDARIYRISDGAGA